jgi:hypothetical protein
LQYIDYALSASVTESQQTAIDDQAGYRDDAHLNDFQRVIYALDGRLKALLGYHRFHIRFHLVTSRTSYADDLYVHQGSSLSNN